jgi:hypothetical protein
MLSADGVTKMAVSSMGCHGYAALAPMGEKAILLQWLMLLSLIGDEVLS